MLLACWEKGKYWVELYGNNKDYYIKSRSGGFFNGIRIIGFKATMTEKEAFTIVQEDLFLYLPTFAKKPLILKS